MKNILKLIKNVLPLLLFGSTYLTAQVVTYDSGTPQRPTAVTGLIVNGATYDVTITYNVVIDGTTLSGLNETEAVAAGQALINLFNTQGIESRATDINIVIADDGTKYRTSNVLDLFAGTNDWSRFGTVSTPVDFNFMAPSNGITNFTLISPPPAPIPTMSQWGLLIFGLVILNLSVFFVQRRELI